MEKTPTGAPLTVAAKMIDERDRVTLVAITDSGHVYYRELGARKWRASMFAAGTPRGGLTAYLKSCHENFGWRVEIVELEDARIARDEIELVPGFTIDGWELVHGELEDAPNPVVAVRPACDGGRAQLRRNGKVDAIGGSLYDLSPGFDSFDELEAWIAETIERELAAAEAELARMSERPFAGDPGDGDRVADRIAFLRRELARVVSNGGRETSSRVAS